MFNQFTFVILKAQNDTGWFTSDNPVIIDWKDNIEAWMVPPQAEIYFPLSGDYLVFMYNHRVKTTNPIAFLPKDEVSEVTSEMQHSIMMNQITRSANKYYICCTDLGVVDVRKS